jgi:hypothetical protein
VDHDVFASVGLAEHDIVPHEPRRELAQVRGEHPLRELYDAVTAGAGSHPIGPLLEHREGVLNRDTRFAFGE